MDQTPLERFRAGLAGADAHDLFELEHEDLAVADLAESPTSRSPRSPARACAQIAADLTWQKVDHVLAPR
jgi:hypothetical protein